MRVLGPLEDLLDALDGTPEKLAEFRRQTELRDKARRGLKLARTYLSSAPKNAQLDPELAGRLLPDLIEDLVRLVRSMPEEFYDPDTFDSYRVRWALDQAVYLVEALQDSSKRFALRQKVEQMENPTGRTPAEAELFRLKAVELRERYNLGSAT